MRNVLLLLLLLSVALPAGAADFLPLQSGNRWTYIGAGGGHQETRIVGTFERKGATVYVMRYASGPDAGLLNFWTSEADGGVLLWGFSREVDGVGWYYDPPLRMVDAPLAVGNRWSQTSQLVDIQTGQPFDEITIGFEVYESTHLDLPAGGFDTYGIGQAPPLGWAGDLARRITVDGRVLASPAASDAVDWWCEGIGDVQFRAGDTYQLESFDLATPVLAGTWGALKQRYR